VYFNKPAKKQANNRKKTTKGVDSHLQFMA